jgi:ADP-ribosylglycohydrolase
VNPTETALLASANAGGENVARGALLGALLGARYGLQAMPEHLRKGLLQGDAIEAEAKDFVDTFIKEG